MSKNIFENDNLLKTKIKLDWIFQKIKIKLNLDHARLTHSVEGAHFIKARSILKIS